MGTRIITTCDSCEKEIKPGKGKIFHGNVYVVTNNPTNRGGVYRK